MEASWIRVSSQWSTLPAAWAIKTGGGGTGALPLITAVAAAIVAVVAIVIGVILVATVVVVVATVVTGATPVATGEEAGTTTGPAVVVTAGTGVLPGTATMAHPLTVAEEGAGPGRAHLPCIGIGAARHHTGERITMSVAGMTPIVEEDAVVVMVDMVITAVDVIEAVREMSTVVDVTGAVKGVVTALNFDTFSAGKCRYLS